MVTAETLSNVDGAGTAASDDGSLLKVAAGTVDVAAAAGSSSVF